MTPRLNPFTASPAAMKPWIELGKTIQNDGLEPLLKELVMMRASQINGCAFCIHHHITDARKYGETEDRLHLLNAWRESIALFRPRASRARLDRGADADIRDPCAGRCLRGAAPAVHRGRAGEAHAADRASQRLEPDQDRLSCGPSGRRRGRRPDGTRVEPGCRRRLRSPAPASYPRCVPDAGLGRGRGRRCPGRFPALARRRPRAVREPAAFLRRVVTRLCLDRLKSARRGRETYVGPWLPEPVVETAEDAIDDVTLPLLMALERLSPLERAAFLLHDVFGLDFEEVAATIGREPAACRQLASRARDHVRADRPRYPVPRGTRHRDRGSLLRRLPRRRHGAPARAARGGRHRLCRWRRQGAARTAPVAGLDDVMRLFAGLAPMYAEHRSRLVRYGFINGLPGFVTIERGDILQTTALEIGTARRRHLCRAQSRQAQAHG